MARVVDRNGVVPAEARGNATGQVRVRDVDAIVENRNVDVGLPGPRGPAAVRK